MSDFIMNIIIMSSQFLTLSTAGVCRLSGSHILTIRSSTIPLLDRR